VAFISLRRLPRYRELAGPFRNSKQKVLTQRCCLVDTKTLGEIIQQIDGYRYTVFNRTFDRTTTDRTLIDMSVATTIMLRPQAAAPGHQAAEELRVWVAQRFSAAIKALFLLAASAAEVLHAISSRAASP
jgi:hypothetical protein